MKRLTNKHHPLFREDSSSEWFPVKICCLNYFNGFKCVYFYDLWWTFCFYDPCGPFLCVCSSETALFYL